MQLTLGFTLVEVYLDCLRKNPDLRDRWALVDLRPVRGRLVEPAPFMSSYNPARDDEAARRPRLYVALMTMRPLPPA